MFLPKFQSNLCRANSRLKSTKHVVQLIFQDSRSSWSSPTVSVSLDSLGRDEAGDGRPFDDIPGPKGLPYIGTLLQYRKGPFSIEKFHEALLQRHEQYGNIYKETIAGHTIVHLFDPDYIKVMYANDGKTPHIEALQETTKMYREYREMSPGLGNTNGEEWYRLRSAVQQMMMRPKAVTQFLPHVDQVINDFVARIKQQRDPASMQVPNFRNEVLKWNLESSTMTCFETRLGCFEAGPESHQQKMLDANTEIFRLSCKLRFSVPWFKLFSTPSWKKLIENEDFFFGAGQTLVDQTVERIKQLVDSQELQDGQYSFLTYLMGRDSLSYKDLSIITLSLFSDGLSTTVPTLIGQLYCIASHPDKQQKLYEEIRAVAPDPRQPVTPAMLGRLTYLKACIKEGFRFFPIGTEVSRVPQKDLVVGGYKIPAGTHVELNNNMLLRLERYFEDAEAYVPERWVRGGSAASIHPYLLLPFGFGPRTCAGKRFADQEMQVMIVRLLQNFRLEWASSNRMRQRYNMLLTPSTTAHFRFLSRH